MKAPGYKAKYFKCFRVFRNPDAQVFETASQLHLRDKRKLKYSQIFVCCQQVCCYKKLYCYGDFSFQRGCKQCYHNAEVSEVLALKCSTSKEEMSKDTEGTVEIGNLRSSCDQFMASAYFKKSKININVNKGMNVIILSLDNVLFLIIREGVNKVCLFLWVSLF